MLEDHGGMGVHEMAKRAWDGAYVGAEKLACGRSHAKRPWPDQEAYEGKDGVANETLAIYFWQIRGNDFIEITAAVVEPRWRYHNF